MDYLEPKELFSTPGYYKNPSGSDQVSNMANAVKKDTDALVLTTEYTNSLSFRLVIIGFENNQYTVTFRRLKNSYQYYTVGFTAQGRPLAVYGVLIKGIITFTDGTQTSFNTAAGFTITDRTLTVNLTIAPNLVPSKAVARISQL